MPCRTGNRQVASQTDSQIELQWKRPPSSLIVAPDEGTSEPRLLVPMIRTRDPRRRRGRKWSSPGTTIRGWWPTRETRSERSTAEPGHLSGTDGARSVPGRDRDTQRELSLDQTTPSPTLSRNSKP